MRTVVFAVGEFMRLPSAHSVFCVDLLQASGPCHAGAADPGGGSSAVRDARAGHHGAHPQLLRPVAGQLNLPSSSRAGALLHTYNMPSQVLPTTVAYVATAQAHHV